MSGTIKTTSQSMKDIGAKLVKPYENLAFARDSITQNTVYKVVFE